MTNTLPSPPNDLQRPRAYGYSRVSTQQQADKGELKDQQKRLKQVAYEHSFDLRMIEDDIGSAHRKEALAGLPGLQAVLRQARDEGGFILVSDISRLSRNLQEWRTRILPSGVDVFSVKEGRFLSLSEQEDLVRKAEAEAKRIGRDTKKALSARPRNTPDSDEMRRRGSVSNVERQMRIDDDLIVAVHILRERGGKITARELGEELVRHGRKPPRGSSFTLDTARERLRAAREQMKLEDEVNAAPAKIVDVRDQITREYDDLLAGTRNVSAGVQRKETTIEIADPAPMSITTLIDEDTLGNIDDEADRQRDIPDCEDAIALEDIHHDPGFWLDGIHHPTDFGTMPDGVQSDDDDDYHYLVRRRIRETPPEAITPLFGPSERPRGSGRGSARRLTRYGNVSESTRNAQESPEGAFCTRGHHTQPKALKARQRRSWGLCGGIWSAGVPKPPPEPKERPPQAGPQRRNSCRHPDPAIIP